MKHRAAAIIIDNGKILLIHRIKAGKEFYVLPGGSVEFGETAEKACQRTVKEEIGLDVQIGKRMYTFAKQGRKEYSFIAVPVSGSNQTGESERSHLSRGNEYELVWIDTDVFREINFLPETLKEIIIKQIIPDDR